jgi:hypothetical protein
MNKIFVTMISAVVVYGANSCAMEQQLPIKPEIKKYLCCPDDFGYLGFLDAKPGLMEYRFEPDELKKIKLCTSQDTKNCNDSDYKVNIRPYLFIRLLLEIAKVISEQPLEVQAAVCLQELRNKIWDGRIDIQKNIDEKLSIIKVTQKDLVHRLLPHIEGTQKQSLWDGTRQWNIILENTEVGLDLKPCIHCIEHVHFSYSASDDDFLFGNHMYEQFNQLMNKHVPSLESMSLKIVKQHRKA